ncbi:MAG TPA: NAD(+) synthase [Clostridia bacterium]|nr:NAD(+) synthase [Clostridia bacterium]
MIKLGKYGFVRVGAACPQIRIADPAYNVARMLEFIEDKKDLGLQVIVFPELSVTGYTCADLFHQTVLLSEAEKQLEMLIDNTAGLDVLIAAGMPVSSGNQLFNCAVVFHKGKLLGVVPKTFIPNYSEFYEYRWFAPASKRLNNKVILCGQEVPFNENLLFRDTVSELCIGLEICEDLWTPVPPSSYHVLHGANLILNLSASNDIIGKAEYRRSLICQQSARCIAGYVYTSAGESESTTDVVFGGHGLIAENGAVLAEQRFKQNEGIYHDIDLGRLMNDRRKINSFMGSPNNLEYEVVHFSMNQAEVGNLLREVDPHPFVPDSKGARDTRCREIFKIQTTGLKQRMIKSGLQKMVIGVSGGLDSTLALLVCTDVCEQLKLPMENIITVTMPGFGTSDRTYTNAVTLMKELGTSVREISIREACTRHFRDIGLDETVHDVTYENVQARERTQILMDIANKECGLVVGTGDLSELALGWCTYNGDHMSMYAVNSSIPKTLVKYLVEWYADMNKEERPLIAKALYDVCSTPVSPELLPLDSKGEISQKTEEIVGSYELHDFFLYNMIRGGYSPSKIELLAEIAFKGKYDRIVIRKWFEVFIKRFFTQQFKRSCMPDGPKVGTIALSPRGDWRMPSDAAFYAWLNNIIQMSGATLR